MHEREGRRVPAPIEWNFVNPLELFVGNDSGLWRSMDGVAESGPVCSPSDASHFQNLNGALGSLAEVESMSAVGSSPYTMLLGLGANGTAGVKRTTGPTSQWPQNPSPGKAARWLSIPPPRPTGTSTTAWASPSTAARRRPRVLLRILRSTPLVSNADVNGDGSTMVWPAPFIVDPLDRLSS